MPERPHLPRADQHLPGQHHAGPQRRLGDRGHAVRAPCPTRLEKSKAPSPVSTRSAARGPLAQPDRVGDQVDARLAGRAEHQQREAEPTGGAGALLQRQPAVHGLGPLLEPAVDDAGAAPRGCPSAGRRSWSHRTARSAGCRRRWPRPAGPRRSPRARRPRSTSVIPSRPAPPASRGDVAVAPRAASRPAPPSLVPLPPSPTTTVRGARRRPPRATSSPTPYVVAASAPSPPVRCRPHACALST